MQRGKYVLLIPSQISEKGVKKLVKELKSQRVEIVAEDKDNNLVFAKWDKKTRIAIIKSPSIQAYHTDKITPRDIKRLPKRVARVAMLWNWSIGKQGRHVTDGEVKRLMSRLQLEERRGRVYDRLTKKYVEKITKGETKEEKGNWFLSQTRGWCVIPTPFLGCWFKLSCKSSTYTYDLHSTEHIDADRVHTETSPGRIYQVVDRIVAEVYGPQHYAYKKRYNRASVYAYDWDFIWIWDVNGGEAYSYAKKGSTTRTITKTILK